MNDRDGIARRILFEDNHLLVIDKPSGLLSQGDRTGDPNVVDLLKDWRKAAENKPGEAFVGLVHRLDRPVSGVMVLAKTSKAARRLTEAWHTDDVVKTYRAVVSGSTLSLGEALDTEGWRLLVDRLSKDERTNIVRVVAATPNDSKDEKIARLKCRVVRERGDLSELEIRLGTGRGHQIRVQLAHRGLVVAGDLKYGSKLRYQDETGQARVALHSYRMKLPHPTLKHPMEFTAPLPPGWPLGGAS